MTHHHPVDWAARAVDLVAEADVNAPMVDQALAWLTQRVPGATRVLDVGSGPGVAACSFAALLPDAAVVAADGAAELLDLARHRAAALGLGNRLTTVETALPDGIAELPAADIVWVSGVAHHMPDPAAAVRDLAALVRPGGVLALREGGLPLRFLPGYADRGLSARMDARVDEMADRHEHPLGAIEAPRSWPELLREAGFDDVRSRTFLLDLPAPLSDVARRQLQRHLRMAAEMIGDRLDADDLAALDRLAADDGPESVMERADAFLLRASTVHTGANRQE
ncbi:MAG TPA: class I SAM-dependent methyltransferase [Actinoplanes sp.]|jgi:SAM-dependent methyltransferase